MQDRDFWAYEGLAKDLLRMCKEVKEVHQAFMDHAGITDAGIKRLNDAGKAKLSTEYKAWYEKRAQAKIIERS